MIALNKFNQSSQTKKYQQSEQYKKDIKDGLNAEIECKERLEKVFGELEASDRYCFYDFSNTDYLIELKSRSCNHDTYETAMINFPKICKWKEKHPNKKFISAFLYKDGLYYWEYNSDEIDKIGTTGRNDRGCIESYEMIYFKHEYLKKIKHPADTT